jgi:glutathione S-transferase
MEGGRLMRATAVPRVTIRHVAGSRSERLIWLMEELGLPYSVELLGSDDGIGPDIPTEAVIDGSVLSESGYVTDFVTENMGGGSLMPSSSSPDYWRYRFYMYFADATGVPRILPALFMSQAKPEQLFREDAASPFSSTLERFHRVLRFIDENLQGRTYVAGPLFSAADILMYFPLRAALQALANIAAVAPDVAALSSLASIRNGLQNYPNIAAYHARLVERPAFHRTVAAANAGVNPPSGSEP